MPPVLLFLLAAILPGIWGWGTYWLMKRFWPLDESAASHSSLPSGRPVDYQI
ncbi:hypothetical protein [Planctellipticum variicoloris]|uniref:hypothetical protein n=1 Tax=Planctellipticum variicoloris TaxID=3064265 RepID=UPI003013CA7E|nr:hypothetical protein SH412_001526 [Planctomycetaceae bacterium SH412]